MTAPASTQTPEAFRCAGFARPPHLVPARQKAARGLCWACYAAGNRRGWQLPPPVDLAARTHALRELAAAQGRVTTAEQTHTDADATVRARVRLAHADGLRYPTLAALIGVRSHNTVKDYIPPGQRRGRDSGGPQPPDHQALATWRTPLLEAATDRDTAADQLREAKAQRAELLDASAPVVTDADVARHLGVPKSTVEGWRRVPRQPARTRPAPPPPIRRCAGETKAGGRCRNRARHGLQTCHDHRDQEPTNA